jgi:hypothetical protein
MERALKKYQVDYYLASIDCNKAGIKGTEYNRMVNEF